MPVVRPRVVPLQQAGVTDVAARVARMHQGGGQPLHAREAQVVAMRGHRMHAHGRIAQQGAAVAAEAPGIDGDQRIGVALAGQPHRAEAVAELRLHLGGEIGRRQSEQRGGVVGAGGDHHRAQGLARAGVGRQRQDGQGAGIAEAFVRGAVPRQRVVHAADDDRAPEIGARRSDTELPPRGGKAAVRRHQQARAQPQGRGAIRFAAGGRALQFRRILRYGHVRHLPAGQQPHARRGQGRGVRRAPQGVVGNDPAQVARAAPGLQAQRLPATRGAVVHMCCVDAPDLVRQQALPGTQAPQRVRAGVGERDFPAVRRRFGQGGIRLALHHRGRETGLRQRDCERQAGGAAAHDQDVAVVRSHGR